MAEARLKIADQDISEDGKTLTLKVYGDPVAGPDGKPTQPVAETVEFDVTKLPERWLHYCAARGLGIVASSRYVRTEDADPAKMTRELYGSMLDNTFSPGRAGTAEPSPFHEALAVLSGVPIHVVENDIETNKDKWTKSYTRTVRNDPRVAAKVAEIIQHRADRDRKAANAKARETKPTLDLGGIFGAPQAEQAAAQ